MLTQTDVEQLLLLSDRARLIELGVPGSPSIPNEYSHSACAGVPDLCRALLRAWALADEWDRLGLEAMAASLRRALSGEAEGETK